MRRHFALGGVVAAAVVSTAIVSTASGAFVYKDDFTEWKSLVPTFTTLGFVGLTPGTFLNDQYLDLGVDFTDGSLIQTGPVIYPQDGIGVFGGCIIDMLLSTPAYAIATHHPGTMRYFLYSGDSLLYVSPLDGDSGYNNFRGIVSSLPFDRVMFLGDTLGPPQCDDIAVDNIYFASVPAPGAAALLAAALWRSRRRVR